MTFPDITADLKSRMPNLRGRLLANQPLAELTWFRVGGPAQVLFMPEDESDLAYFLQNLAAGIPVIVIGLGSNLIVRDGGVPGVVIRLGRGFNEVSVEGVRVRAGSGGAGRKSRASGAGGWHRRPRFLARYPGRHRRRVADEWRRLWPRDQGRAD